MSKVKALFAVVLILCIATSSLLAQHSPDGVKYVPSVIWAPAAGGGTWLSEVQIWATTPGTTVNCGFIYDGGSRGVTLWTSSAENACFRTANILEHLASLDPAFDYYGRSGALELYRTSGGLIQVMARTYHSGGYAKTICGVSALTSNTASFGRYVMIMNVMQSSNYRTFLTLLNVNMDCTVDIQIVQNGTVIGSFSKYIDSWGNGYLAFNVFAEAGLTGTYANCIVLITAQDTGVGEQGMVLCSGATAHNGTNDPAYHAAMQHQ
jgi:hypothetical protein